MGAIWRKQKQYFVEYESDKYNPNMWNRETESYGSYIHFAGNASTIRSAKSIISQIRKERADENPRDFRVYDTFADVDPETNHVPYVYRVD